MGLLRLLPLLALAACCHGAALPESEEFDMETIMDTFQDFLINPSPYMDAMGVREKRHAETENHDGFRVYNIPFVGVEFGVKYIDETNRRKGGEAYLHIADLQSLISTAHSKQVRLHVNFDGGVDTSDGFFNAQVDYHLEHSDGDGTEEGSFAIVRELTSAGKWHTNIKTEVHPFSGERIIPAKISNLEFDVETDRLTTMAARYINVPMDRNFVVNVVRVPGQKIDVTINNKGVVSTINGVLTKKTNSEVEIDIAANIRGQAYNGEVKLEAKTASKVLNIDIKKGTESVLQLQGEYKLSGQMHMVRGKYSVMGGAVGHGDYTIRFKTGKIEVKIGAYKFTAKALSPNNVKTMEIRMDKSGTELWSYTATLSDLSNPAFTTYEASSAMNLNAQSILYQKIQAHYPFGAFQSRNNTFKIQIDNQNRNHFLKKFKIDFDVIKDGTPVVDLVIDTTGTPYNFEFRAPNLFQRMGVTQDAFIVTIDHVRGDHLVINSNIGGNVILDARQAPNSQGGRSIDIFTNKDGVEMLRYHADTTKINNAAKYHVTLQGQLNINSQSLLYRTVVGRYQILTPFNTRTSNLEFFWDKRNKNIALNKFYAKAVIDKDGTNVLNADITTNQKPYLFKIYCPAFFNKFRTGMNEVHVEVDHELNRFLHFDVKHATARWTGFRIDRVGNTNERTIEWNGNVLGSGDFTMGPNSFSTTQTLDDGRHLTTTITWKNRYDSPAFITDNKISVVIQGSERRMTGNAEWTMNAPPDMDLSTPNRGTFKLDVVGNNARVGDYSINRDLTWSSANGQIDVDLSGDANFDQGFFGPYSPILTEIKFTYFSQAHDLVGKFMKNMAGKEYSITFPPGSLRMPTIRVGA